MEADSDGATWLAYPTIPGYKYVVESSSSPAEADFTPVPYTYSYGDGLEHRYYVSSPPPPPGVGGPPPARTELTIGNVQIWVANDAGLEKVQISRNDNGMVWGVVLDRPLVVRPYNIPVILEGFYHSRTLGGFRRGFR